MARADFRQVLLVFALVPLMLLPIWVSTCSTTHATSGASRPPSNVLTAGQ